MIYKNKFILSLIVLMIFLFNGCPGDTQENGELRPAHWARVVEREGLPNLYQVSNALYRGAQPQEEGIKELKKLGINTIVNLRTSNKDQELLDGYEFKYFHLPMNAFLPNKKKFLRFLEIISDPGNQPVFVHCQHGADRTGAAAALYRIKLQKWDAEEAINEMVKGGYHFHKIHSHLKNFIRKF